MHACMHACIHIYHMCVHNTMEVLLNLKTGERASYQPNISDCTHAARLLSSHCSPFVSPQSPPAKPRDRRMALFNTAPPHHKHV